MKKFTMLQMLMVASCLISSTQIYSENQESAQEFQGEAIAAILDADEIDAANDFVLEKIAEISPALVEEIIKDEATVDANFPDIKDAIAKLNKKIEALSEQNNIKDTQIAKFAIELANTKALFKKAIARQRINHKKNHKLEQTIQDNFMKAQQNLRALNDAAMERTKAIFANAMENAQPFVEEMKEKAQQTIANVKQKMARAKKSRSSKAVVKASAQQDEIMEA